MQCLYLYLLVLVAVVYGKPAIRTCPKNFDYSVQNSCFKYVDSQMLRHGDAENYCKEEFGGRLAVLDSHLKMKRTIEYLHTIFDDELQNDGRPTAWVDGKWIRETKHIRYESGEVNEHPHWLTVPIKNSSKLFRFPTSLYGDDAICLLVTLWEKDSPAPRTGLKSGLYNMVCDSFWFTHPLCEVTV